MACPGVAGVLALIRQYYREYNPTSGLRSDVAAGPLGDGRGPSGSLLKATLIASAQPLRGFYTRRTGMSASREKQRMTAARAPENLEGHGRPQLNMVLHFADDAASPALLVYDRHSLVDGAVHEHVVRVASGGYFAAVLTYTDAPGPVQDAWQAENVLVNNLDLAVTCRGCNISGQALLSASRVDNVERVPRRGVVGGSLTGDVVQFRVNATQVLTPEQPYALVVVGKGLRKVENGSTPMNWKPNWSRRVRFPVGEEASDAIGVHGLRSAGYAVVGLSAVLGAVAIGLYCRHEDGSFDNVRLEQEGSM